MKTLQEKINNWKEENDFDYSDDSEREFFEWLQCCEYPDAEVDYNGLSGRSYPQKKWYTLVKHSETEDFYL